MLSGVTKTGGSSNRLLQITHADKVRSSKTTRQFRVTLSAHGFEARAASPRAIPAPVVSCRAARAGRTRPGSTGRRRGATVLAGRVS